MPNAKSLAWMAAIALVVTIAHDRYAGQLAKKA